MSWPSTTPMRNCPRPVRPPLRRRAHESGSIQSSFPSLGAPLSRPPRVGGNAMSTKVNLRVWRGDAGQGQLTDYQVEANEGEVVLDILHRLQATQAGDLA